jgi:hypothetical protein
MDFFLFFLSDDKGISPSIAAHDHDGALYVGGRRDAVGSFTFLGKLSARSSCQRLVAYCKPKVSARQFARPEIADNRSSLPVRLHRAYRLNT